MTNKLRKYYQVILMIAILFLPSLLFAQGPPDPNDVPIDGGLSLLLAAGAAYGVKKYRDYKKNGEEETVEK